MAAKKKKKAKKATKRPAKGALRRAGTLLFTDTDGKAKAQAYARYVYLGARVVVADSWKALAKKLARYSHINTLLLYYHGIPGELIIGGVGKDLSTVGSVFGRKRPRIESIDSMACNVANQPKKMIPFAKLFGATTISGWNHYSVTQLVVQTVPKNVDVAALRAIMQKHAAYWVPRTPTAAQMAARPGTWVLLSNWFRLEFDETSPPPTPPGVLPQTQKWRPRSHVQEMRVSSDDNNKLNAIERERNTPRPKLYKVIIDVKYPPAPKK